MHCIASVLLVIGVALCVSAIEEKVQTGHHERHDPMDVPKEVDGMHNPDYDEEAMLGTHDIGGMSREELMTKLNELIVQHDANHDGHISKEELVEWMLTSFRLMDEEEGKDTFERDDEDHNGFVSWEELLKSQYALSIDQVNALGETEEDKSTRQMLNDDEKRFQGADLDKDGKLNLSEYLAFYHPYDYEHMHVFEVNHELQDRDKDGDRKISLDEYIGEGADATYRKEEEERFMKYDLNGDHKLDETEMKKYILPDNSETALEEAMHLIGECDLDHDNSLSTAEVLECAETFKDVQAVPHTFKDEL